MTDPDFRVPTGEAPKPVEIPEPYVVDPWWRRLIDRWRARWIRRTTRCYWRCYGYKDGAGTGVLRTPWPMNESEALGWLRATTDGSVTYVDRETGMIFYKPKQ